MLNHVLRPLFLLFLGAILSGAVPLHAQDTTCPAALTLALPRANAACARSADQRGTACYGSGSVSVVPQPGAPEPTLTTAGETFDLAGVRSVRLNAEDPNALSVVVLRLQADYLAREAGRSVTVLLFGDAEITTEADLLALVELTAEGSVNVRDLPDGDGDILQQLTLRETIIADGRSEDGAWLRVRLADGRIGWVGTDAVTPDGDVFTLAIVDGAVPVYTPFQVFTLRTGAGDARCATLPQSGALIQSSNEGSPATLVINGVTLRLAGSVFLQSRPTDDRLPGQMTINVLDGRAEVTARDVTQVAPAGARVRVALDESLAVDGTPALAEPYLEGDVQTLPISNLPYRFTVPAPLAPDAIAAFLIEDSAPAAAAPPAADAREDRACRRITLRSIDLFAGPGSFYEVINGLAEGQRVTPVYQSTDANGDVWWQLRNGNWLRASSVREEGTCQTVPVLTVVNPPRNNSLSLEGCYTENGPLRDGQSVEIRFLDGGWDTREEAFEAPNIDPGTITVNGVALGVYPSSPFMVNGRYFRYFSAYWQATSGSYRLVGDRLTYTVSCNVTVPFGR